MMECHSRSLAIAFASLLLAAAARAQSVPAASAENGQTWLVELSNPPAAEGGSASALQSEKRAFRSAAANAGIAMRERFSFDTLWNGISVRADASQLSALQHLPGVKNVWRAVSLSIPPTSPVADPDLITAITMTGADVVQSQLGYTGKGIKVGVIDTGIDYGHPDLGGCFGPGCRVAYGYDFVGDAYDSSTNPVQVPDQDPMDCAGHGTHVAGIVGAHAASSTGVTGVAPDVTFGAYRVFGCNGTTDSDVMIAAMERAYRDGMQVINMSIGSAFTWPEYPTAVAASRLVRQGVVVVASFGNSGANGLYSGGAPGVGEDVIGVASFDNVKQNLASFTASPDSQPMGYITATGAPPAPIEGAATLARIGTPSSTADGCAAATGHTFDGKVVLIRRGTCSFYQKSRNAQTAGAIGVILYNNISGIVSPTVAGSPAVTIPVVSISAADGLTLNNRIAAGATTIAWSKASVSIPNPTGGLISSFSSYGPSPDLSFKPDIGAPGGFIRSTYPRALGSYANLSGTSMSSPHVAGAAALYLQAHPRTHAWEIRGIFQNTADPKLWWGNPAYGLLDSTYRQGAGMLRIDAAIQATARALPAKLALGESQSGPATRTITLANDAGTDVTYTVSKVDTIDNDPGTFTPIADYAESTVSFSASTLTVRAGRTASVRVTISPSADLPDGSLYGGYVVFTPADEAHTIRVPYAGYKGDYQSIKVLQPTALDFPWLAKLDPASGNLFKQIEGATFNVTAGDLPVFLAHLDQQAYTFRIRIYDAAGREWGYAAAENFEVRNTTATGFFGWTWDGSTTVGILNQRPFATVPAGTYTAQIQVLKANGNPFNLADWETWTSPSFNVVR